MTNLDELKEEPLFTFTDNSMKTIEKIIRPKTNYAPIAMGIPDGLSDMFGYKIVKVLEATFYDIDGELWQYGYVGSDDKGLFISLWRTSGDMESIQR